MTFVDPKGVPQGFAVEIMNGVAREMGPHNVHINCITPGAIEVEMEKQRSRSEDFGGSGEKAVSDVYKRLREDGLQPPRIDGCADIEREAKTKTQVEHGLKNPITAAINAGYLDDK